MRRRSRSFAEAAGGAPAGLSLGGQLRQITYRPIVARARRSCRMRRGEKPSMPLRVFALSRQTRGWMGHPRGSLSSCLRADTDDGSPTGRLRVVRPILCRRPLRNSERPVHRGVRRSQKRSEDQEIERVPLRRSRFFQHSLASSDRRHGDVRDASSDIDTTQLAWAPLTVASSVRNK